MVVVVVVSFFFLVIGRENASPWKETDKLLVEVMSIFVAADISAGAGDGEGRRRSTDCDRLGSKEGVLMGLKEELVGRGSKGDGYRLLVLRVAEDEEEEEEDVVVVVVVVEEDRE